MRPGQTCAAGEEPGPVRQLLGVQHHGRGGGRQRHRDGAAGVAQRAAAGGLRHGWGVCACVLAFYEACRLSLIEQQLVYCDTSACELCTLAALLPSTPSSLVSILTLRARTSGLRGPIKATDWLSPLPDCRSTAPALPYRGLRAPRASPAPALPATSTSLLTRARDPPLLVRPRTHPWAPPQR